MGGLVARAAISQLGDQADAVQRLIMLGKDVDLVALQATIEQFGGQRLLSFDRDQVTGSPTVEVAHEASSISK